ncbi:MAG: Uma2 family endonuclease [Xenococcus sp. (in: cyanobacteria)]
MAAKTAEKLLTFEEYLSYEDETNNRYELVDGRLEVMNPPTFRHMLIAKFIEQAFDREISRLKLPWLCLKESGIRTGWRKSRLTDISVIRANDIQEFIDQSAVCQVPPLLAVEIVSPESIKRDYRYKRSEYAALEIPEYWIVDPQENKVTVLLWDEGLYEETVFTGEEKIISVTFSELNLTVKEVLAVGDI